LEKCIESSHITWGDSCVSRAIVYHWFAHRVRERDPFEDVPHIDPLCTAFTLENLEVVHQLIVVDPHTAYQQIEDISQIRSAATEAIRHDYLGLRMITYRSVPYFLIEAQKQKHVDNCLKMLEKFHDGRLRRVLDIVTGDESRFYYYDPELKRYWQVSVASSSLPSTKVRRQLHVDKPISAIFFMKTGFHTTITRANGRTSLAKRFTNEYLSNSLKQVRKGRRLNGLPILHNNASTPKVARTMNLLGTQCVRLTDHSAYALDLSPRDLYTFLKNSRTRYSKNFQDIYELQSAVQE